MRGLYGNNVLFALSGSIEKLEQSVGHLVSCCMHVCMGNWHLAILKTWLPFDLVHFNSSLLLEAVFSVFSHVLSCRLSCRCVESGFKFMIRCTCEDAGTSFYGWSWGGDGDCLQEGFQHSWQLAMNGAR